MSVALAAGGRFPEVVLGISAAVWAAFGVWLFADPAALSHVGVVVETPSARTEVRAFYGGLELGVAAFLAWCLLTDEVRAGLAAALAAILTVGLCRTAAAALERFEVSWLVLTLGAVELASTGLTLAAMRSLATRKAPITDRRDGSSS